MAAVADDSYCATSDVESWVQAGAYGAGTVPTLQQVLEFQKARAGQLYLVLADVLGASAPGPAAYDVTLDTGNDPGRALAAELVRLNSVGAAADALAAGGAGEAPQRSERIGEMLEIYRIGIEGLKEMAESYAGISALSQTHISSGEITAATVVPREEDGFVVNGDTQF